jgi:hypothetical protein
VKNNIRPYSRKPAPVGTLAENLNLLERFANLRNEDAEKFRAEHPGFLLLAQLQESGWDEGFVHRLKSERARDRAREIARDEPIPALRKREVLRRIWRGDEFANEYLKVLLYSSSRITDRVEFNWKRGEIVYEPRDDFEKVVFTLFRNSTLARVCEAEDCPAPYFIAKRRRQRYCSPDCAAQFQKKWKLDWWRREGSQRRQEQRVEKAKKAKKGGKR